eukprot:CAMPEP_0179079692 /NCGR_PEP_ID=MMETSP0796-20121207/35772_1 /TAXON_ID=73915 /ORGANISM="Pyrodinium bahamense, Strain pbaha01" /LENGTH=351 /DNA_ID=CAMNT_0020777033 /DNA_START=495 /DNA_END=1548 /DNA_ORIENTATION=-
MTGMRDLLWKGLVGATPFPRMSSRAISRIESTKTVYKASAVSLAHQSWYSSPKSFCPTFEKREAWGRMRMPCSSPCLQRSTTDSASLPYAAVLARWPGSHLSAVDSFAVRRNLAAERTRSSVAFCAKEIDTTRPRPISPHCSVLSSTRTFACMQRCTTTATPAGIMGSGPGPGAGTPGGAPEASRERGSLASAVGRCVSSFGFSLPGLPGSTSSMRLPNSSAMEGGRSLTSTSGSSANSFIQTSLSIRMRKTSGSRLATTVVPEGALSAEFADEAPCCSFVVQGVQDLGVPPQVDTRQSELLEDALALVLPTSRGLAHEVLRIVTGSGKARQALCGRWSGHGVVGKADQFL